MSENPPVPKSVKKPSKRKSEKKAAPKRARVERAGKFVGETSNRKEWLKTGATVTVHGAKPFLCHGRKFWKCSATVKGEVVRFALAEDSVEVSK